VIAVDTNLVVRLLTRDHEEQFQISSRLFASEDVFVPDTVILETEWVLRYAYDYSPMDICLAFRKLFGLKKVHLADENRVAQAIDWHEQGVDFADALHLALSENQPRLVTFDEKFIKRATHLSKCRVEKP
jgi:predicted nucleic-acid-binding protein